MTAIFVLSREGSSRAVGFSLLILLLLVPVSQALALSLGDLVVHSVPDEPINATIPITLLPEEDLARIRVALASVEEYERQQLKRPEVLAGMRAVLLARGGNAARIRLYGEQPWQGEEAILLLQLQWPGGEMLQRYRIAPADQAPATPLYVEVAQDESLADIAIRLSKHSNRSYLHMMVALFRANQDAFYRNNLNHLKVGAKLRVPSDEELYRLSDEEVNTTLRAHEQRLRAEREKSSATEKRNRELKQELTRVTERGAELEKLNSELKQRLAKLEQQVSSMSQQVLEYAAQPGSKPAETAIQVEANENEKSPAKEGLNAWQMLLLLLLAFLSVILLKQFAPGKKGEGDER